MQRSEIREQWYKLERRFPESGLRPSSGLRLLSKQGNGEERRLIYMAAVSACKTEKWRTTFEKLLSQGHPATAALCIIARKLLRIAFAIYRTNEPYHD